MEKELREVAVNLHRVARTLGRLANQVGSPPATAGPTPASSSAAPAQVDMTPPDPTSSPSPGLTARLSAAPDCGCVWPEIYLVASMPGRWLVLCRKHPGASSGALSITAPAADPATST